MYREDNVIRVAMRPSPSLIYNNLCALGSAGLAYIHTRSGAALPAIPMGSDAKVEVKKIDTQDNSLVQTARSCTVDGMNLLALGNEAGLQVCLNTVNCTSNNPSFMVRTRTMHMCVDQDIWNKVWDETGTNLLFVWQVPKREPASTQHADFVRGIAFTISESGGVQLCAGCSNGSIQVFCVRPGPTIKHSCSLIQHKRPIVALGSSYQSRRGSWSEDLASELISCDDHGTICVWQPTGRDGSFECARTIEGGVPCCSIAVRKGFIVAARVDGVVKMYGLKDGRLRSELVAHSRCLTAMDIHPTKDLIVTAAEDCTLAVWALPICGQKASCLLSVCKFHERLTGAAFCGQNSDSVAAVSYDVEALNIWKFD